ncbi:hypothetical protein [Sphingomonas nostoxanthinifaciens]|uniref:hypothetical protein n=1 Tax=Sphingomonas nostoxanthinifaciens TaxID=2872652 RepID=UPI001CC1CFC4|nr:hypothetical protein [Sphingomonas nostoxanthinifaciens]
MAINDIAAVDREKVRESNRARNLRIAYDAVSGLNQINRLIAASIMGVRWNSDSKAQRQDH